MKKILITILSLAILWGLSFWAYLYYEKNFKEKKNINENNKIETKEEIIEENKNQKEKLENNKIDEVKKKIALKSLIETWNMYSDEDNYIAAIVTYQKALKNIPNDEELNKKIWDIYYEIKNYKKAYEYYEKIKNSEKINKDKLIKSLINYKWVNKDNISELKNKIDSFEISKEKKYYYKSSLDCVIDYSKCRDEFERYFKENNDIKDKNLLNIKTSLENFKNFQSKDLYYKAAFVSWAFYENAFYYLALETSKKVLDKKEAYMPMLKVAAKSAYEIWEYGEAKKYLIESKKLNFKDPELSYLLWRVYEKLNDKILALVHYEKALNDWYKNKADAYKRLIFIYFEKKRYKKMLEIFDELLKLDKENLTETDFYLAIYYTKKYGELNKIKKYSKLAMKYFPDSEIFYSYIAWIKLQKEDLSKMDFDIAKKNIDKALKLNKKNAMVLMIKWIYDFKNKDYNEALVYFKIASSMDKNNEYKKELDSWILKTKNMLKK